MCGYNPTQSDTIPCTRRESLSCPYLSRNLLDITEIHNGGKFLLNRGKAQLLPSLFPFDAVSSSYFVRSTCLLRTINVLTSYDQRAYFVRSKTNRSDVLGKHIGPLGKLIRLPGKLLRLLGEILRPPGKLLGSLGEHMRGNLSFGPMSLLFCQMNLSYFGRSTCLLRPINVLTSVDQRAYFGRSKTNYSDLLAKHIGHFDENHLISC